MYPGNPQSAHKGLEGLLPFPALCPIYRATEPIATHLAVGTNNYQQLYPPRISLISFKASQVSGSHRSW